MENQPKREWRLIAQALSQETNSEKIDDLTHELVEALDERDVARGQNRPEKNVERPRQ